MYFIKILLPLISLLFLSCSSGGPLTPVQSFNAVKSAVEKRDSDLLLSNISAASRNKFEEFRGLVKNMREDQVQAVSTDLGLSVQRVRNLRDVDCVYVYFFSDSAGIRLGKYFSERIVSVDIIDNNAFVRLESGVELDFTREGPYWRLDISRL